MPPKPRARKKSPPRTRARKPASTRTARKTKRSGKTTRLAVSMESLTAAQQATVFRALAVTLRQKGVRGELAEVHFTDESQDIELLRCQEGEVRRMVCAKNANGVVVCGPRCVKVSP